MLINTTFKRKKNWIIPTNLADLLTFAFWFPPDHVCNEVGGLGAVGKKQGGRFRNYMFPLVAHNGDGGIFSYKKVGE